MKTSWSRIALYITIIGMEGCWLFAILSVVNGLVLQGRLSVIGLLALYPVAFGINILVARLKLPKAYLNLISWVIWVGAMILLVKLQLYGSLTLSDPSWLRAIPAALGQASYNFQPEVLLFISSIIIWGLSQRLVHLKADFPKLVTEFQFGIAMLITTFIFGSYFAGVLEYAIFIAAAFFAFALSGLSISHAQQTDRSIWQIYRGRWLGILIACISLIIILGMLSKSAVNPDFFERILNTARWAQEVVRRALMRVADLIPTPGAEEPSIDIDTGEMDVLVEPKTYIFGISESLRNALRLALLINFAFWFIFVIWRISRQVLNWLNRRLASMAGVETESLSGAFRSDVARLVKHILARFRAFLSYRRGQRLPSELVSIQHIYRQMVHWAAAKGCPRQPTQTAYEYQASLVNLLPELHEEFSLITGQFVSARYGGLAPGKDKLSQLRQSWQRIRKTRHKAAPASLTAIS
jgi:hypothetical protein